MRFITGIIVLALLAAAAYAGYWFFAAHQMGQRLEAQVEIARETGWDIGIGSLTVTGFPRAHRIVATDIDIGAPEAQGGWRASTPLAEAEAGAPWDFRSWTLRPYQEVLLQPSGGETVRLTAETASLALDASGGAIMHFYAEAHEPRVESMTAPLRGAEAVYVEGDRDEGAWRVQFEARSAEIAEDAWADARGAFGGVITVLALDLTAEEEGLAALAAGGAGLDQAGDLTISAAHLEWGAAQLSGEGALGVNADGRLRGRFDLAVGDAPGFIGALVGAGIIDARVMPALLGVSVLFPHDQADRVILPFNFQNGETKLGPVTIGPAPLVYDAAPA